MTARLLEGQVALVTGAGRGIGLATAAKLCAAGASVVVNDLTQDAADGAVAAAEAAGGRAVEPQDVANAVYLLCLPEAGYISGEVVVVSGGWLP